MSYIPNDYPLTLCFKLFLLRWDRLVIDTLVILHWLIQLYTLIINKHAVIGLLFSHVVYKPIKASENICGALPIQVMICQLFLTFYELSQPAEFITRFHAVSIVYSVMYD